MAISRVQDRRLWVIPQVRLAICLTPKVACTSIKFALHEAFGTGEYKSSRLRYRHGDAVWSPDEYMKVAPVRSPWERLRSCYAEKVLQNGVKVRLLREMGIFPDMSFEDFVKRICGLPDDRLEKHLIPQHYLVQSPLWGSADRLLRFERMKDDWGALRKLFPALPALGRRNVTRAPKPPWTEKTVQLIGERYSQDVRLLGYEPPL